MLAKSFSRIVRATAFYGLSALILSAGAPAAASGRLSLTSGGVSRSAVVVEHARLKLRRRPLILVLSAGAGVRARRARGLGEAARSAKPIFVYPDSLGGQWPVAPGADTDRDLKYLRDLVAHFVDEGVADPRRIFIVGFRSGGALAYRAACAGLGRPVSGLAALSASMPEDLAACAPPAPLAYIAVNKSQDSRTPYAGGKATVGEASFDALGAEQGFDAFGKINACGARRPEKPFPEHKDAKGAHGAMLSFGGCKAATELIRIDSTRRASSGQAGEAGDETDDFDTNRAVWEFLKRNGA